MMRPLRSPLLNPPGSPEQLRTLIAVISDMEKAQFSKAVLGSPPFRQQATDRLASVCSTDDDLRAMTDFIRLMVRWDNIRGLWLAFYLQHRSFEIMLLLGEAQMVANEDLAFASAETAYNNFLESMKSHDAATVKAFQPVAKILQSRLRFFHAFWSQWCMPFDPAQNNPLTENLYFYFTKDLIRSEFLHLDFSSREKAEQSLLAIIDQCADPDSVYYRIVSRRLLGLHYRYYTQMDAALTQFREGLAEAKKNRLLTEIGHFHRLTGYLLFEQGRFQESADAFLSAFVFEDNLPGDNSYWKYLSARELASVLRHAVHVPVTLPRLKPALQDPMTASRFFFRKSRLSFDQHLANKGLIPVSAAMEQQMFRSYTENAIDQAIVTGHAEDVLAEIEANSPRQITELVAEIRATRELPADSASEMRHAREVFFRHLNTVPETFQEYLESFPDHYRARRTYLQYRLNMIGELGRYQGSDQNVERVRGLRVPGTYFLFFNVGRVSTVALLDLESGSVRADRAFFSEEVLRAIHREYVEVSGSIRAGGDAARRLRKEAVDLLIARYTAVLRPCLEPCTTTIGHRHLKIFPRLSMNAVPVHALEIGGKRLIEYCDVSYNQSIGLFLSQYDRHFPSRNVPPLVIYNKGGTNTLFEGTFRSMARDYRTEIPVLSDPSWNAILSSVSGSGVQDIFFACHGNYNAGNPAASCLEISRNENVPLNRIFSDLDLKNVRSVVLGACDSGLARSEVSAEYIGLPGVFLSAGVQYVISSLWPVEELPTSILFSRYFLHLSTGTHTVPSALNAAQRDMMTMPVDQVLAWVDLNLPRLAATVRPVISRWGALPFSHPYFWAGFFVSGA